jgi:hypothetical protein
MAESLMKTRGRPSEAIMEAIEATVIDPKHLELKKPLALRSGARVSVVVSEEVDEAETARLEATGEPGPMSHRQREQAWRQTHDDILRGYAGQWLVLEGEEVIAHGDDPADLVSQARERGISSPYVFFVEPVEPDVVRIGL